MTPPTGARYDLTKNREHFTWDREKGWKDGTRCIKAMARFTRPKFPDHIRTSIQRTEEFSSLRGFSWHYFLMTTLWHKGSKD
jgi:hypothetical protein